MRAVFDALDELPRAEARGLQDRFERALGLCEAQIARQHARDAEQSFANLLEAGRHIRACEWATVRQAEVSERETLKQAAEQAASGRVGGCHGWVLQRVMAGKRVVVSNVTSIIYGNGS